jgi:hypothetical protein
MNQRIGPKNGMFGKSQSPETRKAISEARKNTKWVYDPANSQTKAVKIEEVEKYLAKGWRLGRPKKSLTPEFLKDY